MRKIVAGVVFLTAFCIDIFSFASVLNTEKLNISEITSVLIVLSFLSVFFLVPIIIAHSLACFIVPDMKRNEKTKRAIVFVAAVFTGFFAVALWIIKRILDLRHLYLTYDRIELIDVLITAMPVLMFFICIAIVCIVMLNIRIIKKKQKKQKTVKKRANQIKKSVNISSKDEEKTKQKGETEWEK